MRWTPPTATARHRFSGMAPEIGWWTVFLGQLRARGTLLTALVVGTLINAYGQVLVPLLRGRGAVTEELVRNLEETPLLGAVSIALGFIFPLFVSAYASARARVELGAAASLARFPDLKPDPVFRAQQDGTIIEAGAQTRILFERHGVGRAQDIIGSALWERIAAAAGHSEDFPAPETVHFPPADRWYVVTASTAPDGINFYLAGVSPGGDGSNPTQSRGSP